MGGGSFSYDNYSQRSASLKKCAASEVLKSTKCNPIFDPKNIKIRESRNSADHPVTTPIIVALDVTGSMGGIAIELLRSGVGRAIQAILSNDTIRGPQIMFMAVGDSKSDATPLQATQFESDNRMVDQLQMIWNHRGGGGNGGESYSLPWMFADKKVVADAIEAGGKGYIFTIGDEPVHRYTSTYEQEHVFGSVLYEGDVQAEHVYQMTCKKWNIFHFYVDTNAYHEKDIRQSFSFMEDHFIKLKNPEQYLPEMIGAVIGLNEGSINIEQLIADADPQLRFVYEAAFL